MRDVAYACVGTIMAGISLTCVQRGAQEPLIATSPQDEKMDMTPTTQHPPLPQWQQWQRGLKIMEYVGGLVLDKNVRCISNVGEKSIRE